MKQITLLILGLITALQPVAAVTSQAQSKPSITIAILCDGPATYYDKAIHEMQEETYILLGDDIHFLPLISGDWDVTQIKNNVNRAYTSINADIIIGIGYFTSQYILDRESIPKPTIIADLLTERELYPYITNNTSNIKNLTFLLVDDTLEDELKLFYKITPFSNLGILVSPLFYEYASQVKETYKDEAFDFNIKILLYADDVQSMVKKIKEENIDAIYLTPAATMGVDYSDQLIEKLNEEKIPTFAMIGQVAVARGALAGYFPKILTKFSRRVALLIERLIDGQDPTTIDVRFEIERYPFINAKTASQLGVSIPFDLLLEAEVIESQYLGSGKVLSVKEAVTAALANNFNFDIKNAEINKARSVYHSYWSKYLPDITATLDQSIVDQSRTDVDLGITPKREIKGSLTLNQLIFSDSAFTAIGNSKRQLQIEKLKRETIRLDITEQVIKAYLQFLKAKALLQVEDRHLKTVKFNLRNVENKAEIGTGSREEVLRWRSEEADAKARLLQAQAGIRQARIALNQLMNVDQEQSFTEQDVNLEMLEHFTGPQDIFPFLTDFNKLELLLDFFVQEALQSSNTLKALEVALLSQKAVKSAALRKFFLPEVSMQASYERDVKKWYTRGFYSGIDLALPDIEDRDDQWSGLLRLEYPLFQGGKRFADYSQEKQEYQRLLFQYKLKQEEVELNIRNITYSMYYSLPKIEFSVEALKNASENLSILQEKYNNGLISITTLIDAEENRFAKELDSMVAVYNFLYDLTSLDRYLTHFSLLTPREQQQEWLNKVVQHFGQKQ